MQNDEEKDVIEQEIITESIVSRISTIKKPIREKRETKYIKSVMEKRGLRMSKKERGQALL